MRLSPCLGLALVFTLSTSAAAPAVAFADDLSQARAVFERNLDAIAKKDKDAYLSCYLPQETFVRTGPEGMAVGFQEFAAGAGQGWPDHISAEDLRLTPIAPGVVYGTYRYRVRYGALEQSGLSERVFLATPDGWKIAVSTAFQALPGVPPPPKALVGATLVDGVAGSRAISDSVVILRDGKIDCAGSRAACPVPAGIDVMDVSGRWIVPGLIDAHVHFSQTGWADGRPDALDVRAEFPYEKTIGDLRAHPERFFRSNLCSGVTAVFDVGGYSWTLDLPARAENDTLAPHVRAAGPLLSTVDHWLNLPAEKKFVEIKDAETAKNAVRALVASGAQAVKVWYIVDADKSVESSIPAVRAAGDEAKSAGLPLLVHATGLAEAKEALRAGAKLLVHSVSDRPIDDEFIDLAKRAGTIYCPTLTVRDGYTRMHTAAANHTAPAIDDPNGCVDQATKARIEATAKATPRFTLEELESRKSRRAREVEIANINLKRLAAEGIPLAMGTDAGNPLTLHGPSVYAEMEAMEAAGLTPREVLDASTRGGALAMGREKDLGTIEKGKIADLVIVGADPTAAIKNLRAVQFVVRAGVVRGIGELRALASGPEGN